MKTLALFVVVLFIAGCSTSEQAANTSDASAQSGSDSSSADQVGSVPEDMLANETGGGDTGAEAENSSDPFADLKTDQSASNVTTPSQSQDLAVIENGETSAHNNSDTGNMAMYTVKAGDTLMKIAFQIYGDLDRWQDLRDWNSEKIKSAKKLRAGMQLKYDSPSEEFQPEALAHSYTIKSGDTLGNIADEVYGRRAKYKKLQNYNAKLIKNPNRIFAGFTLYYDITEQEMAEAETRRHEREAQGIAQKPNRSNATNEAHVSNGVTAIDSSVPSALSPPVQAIPAPAPQATAQPIPVPVPEAVGPPAPAPLTAQ